MHIAFLIAGLALLIWGSHGLLKSAVAISLRLHISRMVIGMTIVSFVTSAPELLVSVQAAWRAHADLALGNVVGSNIANLGLVLAVTLLASPIDIRRRFYQTDWPALVISSLLLFSLLCGQGVISRRAGFIMIGLLVWFLRYLIRRQKPAVRPADARLESDWLSGVQIASFLLLGGAALWAGSRLLISGAVGLAQSIGVTDRVIGVTAVSIGTSIPELSTSVVAAVKREKAISLGNLLGSNIFNILGVLGITAAIQPIKMTDKHLLYNDVIWMLGYAFALLPLVCLPKRMRLGPWEGAILLVGYCAFVFFIIVK